MAPADAAVYPLNGPDLERARQSGVGGGFRDRPLLRRIRAAPIYGISLGALCVRD